MEGIARVVFVAKPRKAGAPGDFGTSLFNSNLRMCTPQTGRLQLTTSTLTGRGRV